LSQKKIIKEIDNKFTCFAICVIIEKGIFITGGESHDINVFRTDDYNCIQTFKEAHNDNIYGITQLKNGKIVSYSGDSKIKIWSI
jgi:WD40 repeat protein